MDTISLGVVGLSATVLTLVTVFCLGFTVAFLGDAVGLGSCFFAIAVFLVLGTLGTWDHRDLFRREIWIWSSGLDDMPPRKKCYHHLPRFICSAEDPTYLVFEAAGCPVAALFRLRCGACFAKSAFSSFHLIQPR